MSLHHGEADRVFPTLYLPIMEECHKRVLARWREYNPLSPSWWRHRTKTRKLNTYIYKLIRERWDELEAEDRCVFRAHVVRIATVWHMWLRFLLLCSPPGLLQTECELAL